MTRVKKRESLYLKQWQEAGSKRAGISKAEDAAFEEMCEYAGRHGMNSDQAKLLQQRSLALSQSVAALDEEMSNIKRLYNNNRSPAAVFSDLELTCASAVATSDINGLFELTLRRNETYAIAAQAKAQISGVWRDLYWFVWFTPQEGAYEILLSNENLMTCNHPSSVITLPQANALFGAQEITDPEVIEELEEIRKRVQQ